MGTNNVQKLLKLVSEYKIKIQMSSIFQYINNSNEQFKTKLLKQFHSQQFQKRMKFLKNKFIKEWVTSMQPNTVKQHRA